MNKYGKIAAEALRRATKKVIKEGRLPYGEGVKERMSKQLEEEIREGNSSVGGNAILPEGDEVSFIERVMTERFNEVVERYKRTFEVDEIVEMDAQRHMMGLVQECMEMEVDHRDALVEIAVDMIREEYGISEDMVQINAEICDPKEIDSSETPMTPQIMEMEFDDAESMGNAGKEVQKRRFMNAMTQGAAMKTNHMFHMAGDDLAKLNPRLPNAYNKMMSSADYHIMSQPNLNNSAVGGKVKVDMPKGETDVPVINAQAVTFPVLVHEIVKGVMEILSSHGLPEDNKLAEYCMGKADYVAAELPDMQIGPALWGRFTNMLEGDMFEMKHHIYAEMCAMPTDEFNSSMKEIMGNTKKAKDILENVTKVVRRDLVRDEYEAKMNEEGGDEGWSLDDFEGEDLI